MKLPDSNKPVSGIAGAVHTDAYQSIVGDSVIVSSVRTIENPQGEVVGVQGMDISLDGLTNMIRNIQFGEKGYLMLVDSNGTVLVNPESPEQNFQNIDSIDAPGLASLHNLVSTGESHEVTLSLGGVDYQAMAYVSPELTWTLIGLLPRDEMLAGSNRLALTLAALGGGCLILCMGVSMIVVRYLTRPIRQVAKSMSDIASGEGDLTQRLVVQSKDEVGELAAQFNAFVERMQNTLVKVRDSAKNVLNSSNEMAAVSGELSTRTEQSAANLQETSASMDEISSTVLHTADSAEQADKKAKSANRTAREGVESIHDMQVKMQAISESALNIGEITTLIDSIAFQTNILALNASVEAARAGDHGKGFAVVAQEVRQLASRAGDSAKNIRELIEDSIRQTKEGSQVLDKVVTSMQTIQVSVSKVSDVIEEISCAAKEQSEGIAQVNVAVAEMDTITQQNATVVTQSATPADSMRDTAKELDIMLNVFILDGFDKAYNDRLVGYNESEVVSLIK